MEKKQKKASNSELTVAWLCFNALHPTLEYSNYLGTWHVRDTFDSMRFIGCGKTLNEAVLDFYHNINKEKEIW